MIAHGSMGIPPNVTILIFLAAAFWAATCPLALINLGLLLYHRKQFPFAGELTFWVLYAVPLIVLYFNTPMPDAEISRPLPQILMFLCVLLAALTLFHLGRLVWVIARRREKANKAAHDAEPR